VKGLCLPFCGTDNLPLLYLKKPWISKYKKKRQRTSDMIYKPRIAAKILLFRGYHNGLSTMTPVTCISSQMLTGTRLMYLIRMIIGVRIGRSTWCWRIVSVFGSTGESPLLGIDHMPCSQPNRRCSPPERNFIYYSYQIELIGRYNSKMYCRIGLSLRLVHF
jgi:hypothetical protein